MEFSAPIDRSGCKIEQHYASPIAGPAARENGVVGEEARADARPEQTAVAIAGETAGALVLTARSSLKVVAALDPAELLDVPVPDGKPRLVLTIRLSDGAVTADLNAKSVRRAIAMIRSRGQTMLRRWCRAD